MKLKNYIGILLFSAFVGTSCQDENEIQYAINPVGSLKAISGDHQVNLSWDNPADKSLSYIGIVSTNMNTTKADTFKYETKEEIHGEYTIPVPVGNEKDVYRFTVVAHNASGGRSEARYVKGKAFSDDSEIYIIDILNSISAEPVANGGVKFTWENENNVKGNLKVDYTIKGQSNSVNFDLLSASPEGMIDGGVLLETTFVIQIVMDDGTTMSDTRELVVRPISYPKMDKSRWKIYSFSSQKASSGNGSASCLIDNASTTMWSASVSGANQYIIVDLGGSAVLDKFSLERNFGESNAAGWDLEYSIGDDADNDVWSYIYSYFTSSTQGAFFQVEFNRTIDGEQLYQLPLLSKQITGRYIKIKVTRIASGGYMHFGEFNVYGAYLE